MFISVAAHGQVRQSERPQPSVRLASCSIEVEGPPQRIVTDAGAGGYQAFPDVCRLKNGDLLCVFYAGYGHVSQPNAQLPKGGRVCAIRSTDDGKTWSAPATVVDTPADDRDPSVACLPDGTLLCNFFTYGKYGECDTCIVRSTDGGRTWSAPDLVAPSFATSSPIRPPPLRPPAPAGLHGGRRRQAKLSGGEYLRRPRPHLVVGPSHRQKPGKTSTRPTSSSGRTARCSP